MKTAGALLNAAVRAQAAYSGNIAKGFGPLIDMIQDFCFPIGIAVSLWGIIELMLGNPGGKDKVKWAVIGYIGAFVIPFLFEQIRIAFR